MPRLGLEEMRFPALGTWRAEPSPFGAGALGRDSPRLVLEELQSFQFGAGRNAEGVPKRGDEGSGVPALRGDARGSQGPGCGRGMPYASWVPSTTFSSWREEKKKKKEKSFVSSFLILHSFFSFPSSPFPPLPPGSPAMRGRPPPPARRRRQPGSRLAPLIAPGRSPPRLKAAAPRGRGAAARPCVGLRF